MHSRLHHDFARLLRIGDLCLLPFCATLTVYNKLFLNSAKKSMQKGLLKGNNESDTGNLRPITGPEKLRSLTQVGGGSVFFV